MKFNFGQLVATPNALESVEAIEIQKALRRHSQGDWGDVSEQDKKSNDNALANGQERLFSSYKDSKGEKFWIITEADRSSTTVLLPEDY